MNRAAPMGSDRQRAYGVLSDLTREGWINGYRAMQLPNGRWGFRVVVTEGSDFIMLPREVLAFAEGVKVASQ